MSYQVQKRFLGPGLFYEVGEVVDAENWRNLKSLIGLRYLVQVDDDVSNTKVNKTASKKIAKINVTV